MITHEAQASDVRVQREELGLEELEADHAAEHEGVLVVGQARVAEAIPQVRVQIPILSAAEAAGVEVAADRDEQSVDALRVGVEAAQGVELEGESAGAPEREPAAEVAVGAGLAA